MLYHLVCILITFLHLNTLLAHSITPIMKHNLAIYPWEDEDWPNERYGDFLQRCMRYQHKLQPFKKYRIVWNILNRNWTEHDDSILHNDFETLHNIELIGPEKNNVVDDADLNDQFRCTASIIDRTSTAIGHVTLTALIAQPTDNHQELLRRQSCVKFLLEHEDLCNVLDTYLQTLQKSENFFLSFWNNDPLQHACKKSYFTISRAPSLENALNNNIPALTCATLLEHQKRITSVAATILATVVLPIYGINLVCNNSTLKNLAERLIGKDLAERLIGSGGPLFSFFSLAQNKYMQSGGFILAGFHCGLRAQEQIDWMCDNFTLDMCLQKKLSHVAHFLRTIEKIGDTLQQYPEINFANKMNFHELLHTTKISEPALQQLFELLQSSTFRGQPSFIANYGKILLTYKLMHENKAHLEPLLCLLGELDTYMSIARLYKEFEHQRVRYTFAHYTIDHKQPFIMTHNLWSPFIDPSYVVPNSIEIGINEIHRNVIITGPNEGGKSTFVKALTTSLILAQSIGIAPAQDLTISPFSYIATYLNITDDHGKSLFEAQVQRAKQIINHIDSMQHNEYSFVIIDELFNGTDARVGQAISYSIANHLSNNKNVISIFPTHFPELTLLEKDGYSTNYKVSASIDEQGNISYPFILEQGASSQNIVFDILRNEGFNPTIIEQAMGRITQ